MSYSAQTSIIFGVPATTLLDTKIPHKYSGDEIGDITVGYSGDCRSGWTDAVLGVLKGVADEDDCTPFDPDLTFTDLKKLNDACIDLGLDAKNPQYYICTSVS